MIDIKLIRENKDLVKENIRKKFQELKSLGKTIIIVTHDEDVAKICDYVLMNKFRY